jgi:DNA polymerase-3 subunit alpha
LEGLAKGTDVALCGILTGIQRRRSKEGKLWASMQIEDLEGSAEAMVFSTQYERLLSSLVEDKAVLVRGLVLPEENAPPKISVQDIVPLEVASVSHPSLISIRVPVNGAADSDRAAALRQLFDGKPGQTEVRLRIEKSRDFSVILDVTAKVRPDKEFRAEIVRICGAEAMEVLAG